MNEAPYQAISGQLLLVGKSPDGDSVRFKADDSAELKKLQNSRRLRPSTDGTVQLRLEAVDAPETHYNGQSQPLGIEARAGFLKALGFKRVEFSAGGVVVSAQPTTLPATIIAKMIEVNGRPVAYLFTKTPPTLSHGDIAQPELLEQSLNAVMLREGFAYPTLYTSTPVAHRQIFAVLAAAAKAKRRGIWQADKTAAFELSAQASIGPGGQLILPKLFRRCTDYLRAKSAGSQAPFLEWLTTATSAGFSEDDELFLAGERTRLSHIIAVNKTTIHVTADLLKVVFIEK